MYFGLLSIGLLNIQSMLQDQLLDGEQGNHAQGNRMISLIIHMNTLTCVLDAHSIG